MSKVNKKEIIAALLTLSSEYGLSRISMSMVADKVGIKKPSLYNHFASKEELVEAAYRYLRERAKEQNESLYPDFTALFAKHTAAEILKKLVDSYIRMNEQEEIRAFYKIIYSERCFNKTAAKIMTEETERMIAATTALLCDMNEKDVLRFSDAKTSALSFALTVHGIMDYGEDKNYSESDNYEKRRKMLEEYIEWFCKENSTKEKR